MPEHQTFKNINYKYFDILAETAHYLHICVNQRYEIPSTINMHLLTRHPWLNQEPLVKPVQSD